MSTTTGSTLISSQAPPSTPTGCDPESADIAPVLSSSSAASAALRFRFFQDMSDDSDSILHMFTPDGKCRGSAVRLG